jgi:amino-acid N-acetyltransferase
LPAVETLLAANELPLEGVRDNFARFLVAEEDGLVVGAVGLETFDSVGLLRSAVVARDHRGTGVGRQLVEQVLERAEREGVNEVYLLTTTAEDYFPRFGFDLTDRDGVPDALKMSEEFRGACPETAVVMTRRTRR